MSSTTHERPKRHPESAFRNIEEEGGIVVLPGRSEVKVLNPVGSTIFSLLDGEHSRDEIVRAVVTEFEVEESEARQHLDEFLTTLSEHGMLLDKPGSAP